MKSSSLAMSIHELIHDFDADEPMSPTPYKVYRYRFVIVIVFILGSLMNAMMWQTFAPLQTQLQDIYGISLTWVSFGTIVISNVAYAPGSLLANFLIDKIGFRYSIIVGSGMTLIGMWVRIFASSSFLYIFIGQVFAGLAQSFFYSTGQKVSVLWFPANERALATTTIYGLLPLGNSIGASLPEIFVDPAARGDAAFTQLGKLLRVSAYIGTAVFVILVVFFREKPPSPPSKAAAIKRFNFYESMSKSFRNGNLMLLIFAISISTGASISIATTIEPLYKPYNVTQNQVATILIFVPIVGCAMNYLTGFIVSRTKTYKNLIGFTLVAATFVYGFMPTVLGTENLNIIIPFSIVGGCMGISALPSMFELMSEISFPVAEEVPGSLFTLGYQISGTLGALGIDQILNNDTLANSSLSFYILTAANGLSVLAFFLVREELHRKKMEKSSILEHEIAKDPSLNRAS